MNMSLVLMSKLTSMMVIAAVGFVTVRAGLLEEGFSRQLARLILYVAQPCMIVLSFQIDLTPARLHGFLAAIAFSAAVQAAFILAAGLLRRLGMLELIDEMSLIYTNCGNLILPIVSMAMGEEMVFYASAYQVTFNVLFWTHGISRMEGGRQFAWKKILLNPNILAIITGIVLLMAQIPIPEVAHTSMQMLSNMVGPAVMLTIGMTMAGSRLREFLTDRRACLVAFLRLAAFPLLTVAALFLSGFLTRHPELAPIFRISFLAVAAPPAANVAQLAMLYDREPVRAGIYNLLCMLLCMFTIPLIDFVYAAVFLG